MKRNAMTPSFRSLHAGITFSCTLLGALALAGCSQEAASDDDVASVEQNLYLGGDIFTWATTAPPAVSEVKVCFDGNDGNNPSLLAETQRLVNASWGRAANLSFTGWGQCNLTPGTLGFFSTIALHFCGGSSTSAECPPDAYERGFRAVGEFLGRSYIGRRPATRTPPSRIWTPGVTNLSLISDDPRTFADRFRYQVVHEFGHALGYRHEQDSTDTVDQYNNPAFCPDGRIPATTGSSQTGFLDMSSVMMACTRDPLTGSNLTTTLSSGDILGVRAVYGRKPESHGFLIRSDRNAILAVNAFGGAKEGTVLKLHNGCTETNPDCTWSYQRGRISSDTDPTLVIKAVGGAAEGTVLKLTRDCVPNDLNCSWIYKGGQFLNEGDPSLAINASGGAQFGTTLVTTAACTAGNDDCTWILQNVMLSSYRNTSLAVNAFGGAGNHVDLKLHNACTPQNLDCTFIFRKGMITSSANASWALNAVGGAANNTTVEINDLCTASNPDCTWTWRRGQLISDNATNGTLPINAVGGAVHLANLKLRSDCTETNPDCVFLGLFGRN